ncbi:thiopurine S-methyltransferase [Candidatus Poseidoniaceae archaeon]|nr:thiopurine S-methyltransferase [Candidatus Poseidoniaceae archaeon]
MTFWHQRWDDNQTGWHRDVVNDLLIKHWPSLNLEQGINVLVPLCGKSVDMHWLVQQGHSVTGIELVETAVEAFFSEAKKTPTVESLGEIKQYKEGKTTLLQGDVMAVRPTMVSSGAWYDRAALIALPSTMRPAYVKQIRALCQPGSTGLMITFSYPQKEMQGPPFSLPDEEVLRLFEPEFEVELLERIALEDEKQRGLTSVHSAVYKLTRT